MIKSIIINYYYFGATELEINKHEVHTPLSKILFFIMIFNTQHCFIFTRVRNFVCDPIDIRKVVPLTEQTCIS